MTVTQKLPRAEQKAQTRHRILKEAAAVLRAGGSERVSVAAIMTRAGLTVGGFYAHFTSKDDLIAEAVTYMFEDRYAAFLAHLDTPEPKVALARFVDSYLSMRHRDAIEQGCPIPGIAAEIGRLPEPIVATFVAGIERLTIAFATLLEHSGHRDPAAAASSAISEMTGALGLARAQPDTKKAAALLSASRQSVKVRCEIESASA